MTANNNNVTIKNNTNIKEVIGMNINVENIKDNVKAVAGETREDFVNRADASVNELKDMLMGTVKYIGDVLGLTRA